MVKIFRVLVIVFAFGANGLFAQQSTTNNSTTLQSLDTPPRDGYLKRQDFSDRKPIKYLDVIRDGNYIFVKRLWQEIDLRDPVNAGFATPTYNLMKALYEAMLREELTAYDPYGIPGSSDPESGEKFEKKMTLEEFKNRINEIGGDSTLVDRYDDDGNVIDNYWVKEEFNPSDVVKFRIKEDWIFDQTESVLTVRIVGIAPMVVPKIFREDSADLGDPNNPGGGSLSNTEMAVPICWINFDEARQILATIPAPTPKVFNSELSYDDILVQRLFSSYVVKENRPDGLWIRDYMKDRVDQLKESDRIKKSLIEFEQKRWTY
jgi:gliding motility associated protien GldN